MSTRSRPTIGRIRRCNRDVESHWLMRDAVVGAAVVDGQVQTWATFGEALRVVNRGDHLHRTLATAAIVGTVLFVINQLNVVLAGHATTLVWFKAGLTYLVPFAVSNIGILIATHRRPQEH